MADFEAQVNGLTDLSIGASSASPSRDELTQFLKDGVLDVTNKTIALKSQDAFMFMRGSSDEGTSQGSLSSDSGKVLTVVREAGVDNDWRDCRFIPLGLQSRVTDTGSLYYASKYNPSYTIEDDGKVNVYPAPSPNPDAYKIYFINGTPVDNSGAALACGASTIKYFPEDKLYLVTLYASVQSLKAKMASKNTLLPSDLALPVMPSQVTLDTTIATSLPTFASPSGFVLPQAPADADISFTSVPTFPAFIKPTFTAPTLATIDVLTLPSSPVVPNIDLQSVAITTGSITQDGLNSSLPTYTKPTLVLGTLTITDLTVSSVAPVVPSIDLNTVSITGDAPTYTSPVLSLDSLTISDLSITSIIPVVPALSDNSITFSTAVPTYTAPVVAPDFSDANTWINTEEDSEMTSSRLGVIGAQLQEYQSNIQNATNKFNKENVQYQAELQEATENARLSSQDDGQKLQKYGSEIQSYQADVNKQVQEHQQNFQSDFQVWQAKRQTDLQKYGTDIQNTLNSFNKENAEYQAILQKDLQDGQLAESEEGRKLQKYANEIQVYQADINKEVQVFSKNMEKDFQIWQTERTTELQKYGSDITNELNEFNEGNVKYQATLQAVMKNIDSAQQNEANKLQSFSQQLALYQAEVNSAIQLWTNEEWNRSFQKYTTDYSSLLNEYSTNIQNETARVGNEVQEYSQEIAKATQTYQAETGYDLSKYTAQVQGELQRFTQDLTKNSTTFTNEISKHSTEVNTANTLNGNKLSKYTAEVQTFTAEIQSKVSEYDARLKKQTTDYQWLNALHDKLKAQYDEAFMAMARMGEQQAQQQARG